MIITLAEILPSPGTATVRDWCSGHLMQTRIFLAKPSNCFIAGDFVTSGFGSISFLEISGALFRRGLRAPSRLGRARTVNEGFSDPAARLSIRQLLLFYLRRHGSRIFLMENFLKSQRGPGRVISLVVVID